MKEQRKNPRHKLRNHPIVHDRILGMVIGRALGLLTGGLRLMTDTPIAKLTRIECRLQLPEEIDAETQVPIDICFVWCRENTPYGAFEAGFRFLNPSEQDLRILHKFQKASETVFRATD